jgi:hypothetical protein
LWRHSRNAWRGGGALISRELSARGAGESGADCGSRKDQHCLAKAWNVFYLCSHAAAENISCPIPSKPRRTRNSSPSRSAASAGLCPPPWPRCPGRAFSRSKASSRCVAPVINPARLPAPPFVRPDMAPQAIEKPRFALGNGAPLSRRLETNLPPATFAAQPRCSWKTGNIRQWIDKTRSA